MPSRGPWAKQALDYEFSDQALLEQALTHRSASKINNERLEFLGDAMLSFVIARELYLKRPDAAEGDLSRARAALVNRQALARIGRQIGVDFELTLGSGELRSGGAHRSSALADTLEALIGAVLLDGGYEAADRLILKLFRELLDALPDTDSLKDAKTKLQEWLQARNLGLPIYLVDAVSGKDHSQVFVVSCEVPSLEQSSHGRGTSRRRAEQDAAAAMLAALVPG